MFDSPKTHRSKRWNLSVFGLFACIPTLWFFSASAQPHNSAQHTQPTQNGLQKKTTPSSQYGWRRPQAPSDFNGYEHQLESRIQTPSNASRVHLAPDSFGAWLRGLPLKRKHAPVHLFNGSLKSNQDVHEAVVAIDIGSRNLQQCADSVIRLRAEFLYAQTPRPEIAFHYTSGHRISFSKWASGFRPVLTPPNKSPKKRWTMAWEPRAKASDSRKSFKAYLKNIFAYAGTMSLSKNLPRRMPKDIEVGDIYLEGGFPGHTVMVVDKAIHAVHGPLILIAQGFMPAQSLHVLKNTREPVLSPWFRVPAGGRFYTPEFTFNATDLYYFND
jgi:hypothetical protein